MKKAKLKIEELPVEALRPYENNARQHGDEDVDAIVDSIEQFGFSDPIGIWSKDNLIVEGHGRLLAAKKLGMETVPCIRLDHLTDDERRAYALAHNKTAELSSWNFEMLTSELQGIESVDMSMFGFDVSKLAAPAVIEEDDFDEEQVTESRAKLGDIWVLGKHRLMCGDSSNPESVKNLMGGRWRTWFSQIRLMGSR